METPQARALSRDGLSWQLQVLTERPEHTWGSLNRGVPVKQFFRFGTWQPSTGTSRIPLNPILDIGAMIAAADQLVGVLRTTVTRVPFELGDGYERWLLDKARQPLALLGTTTQLGLFDNFGDVRWAATLAGGRPFVSSLLTFRGIPSEEGRNRRRHAEQLERQFELRAGVPPQVQWFERRPDGSGIPIDASGNSVEGVDTYPASVFPQLGVSLDWQDPDEHRLLWDYLEWNSPRLLMLPGLPDAIRHRLEASSTRHATLVADLYRLYPRILNQDWIDAARVEARLRRAASVKA